MQHRTHAQVENACSSQKEWNRSLNMLATWMQTELWDFTYNHHATWTKTNENKNICKRTTTEKKNANTRHAAPCTLAVWSPKELFCLEDVRMRLWYHVSRLCAGNFHILVVRIHVHTGRQCVRGTAGLVKSGWLAMPIFKCLPARRPLGWTFDLRNPSKFKTEISLNLCCHLHCSKNPVQV
jgi:hypothetical protein